MTVTFIFIALFILGVGVLVRGLMTVSTARAAWMVRSVSGTARVTGCKSVYDSNDAFNSFGISIQYTDTHGQAHTAELPAMQQFQTGDPVDIRFDPQDPATVYLSEHFAASNLSIALIAFGGALMLVRFISLVN